ncbi:MAG: ribosome biogenesis GTPase Der [Treponema sp.]|nr:ribosome biogenesis GTPase Der [Treponema sp.]MCL2272700.1 ribosome biogenesis GTPase Der [Treponema sp.]
MTPESGIRYKNLPEVVLAGRPNTGKSTLFNRLLRKRRAITDPTPGVTRDPVEADCLLNEEKPVRLIDTGGFKLADCGEIDRLVVEKTLNAVKNCDLVVLLLEAGEITSEDEELIGLLRPYKKKLIAAVNKTEGGRLASDAWNVLSFGFEKVLMISAEHGDNVGELQQEIIKRLDFSKVEELRDTADREIRIALLGKPNTGKSTLSNRLTGAASSIVSEIPGTTRDTVEGRFSWKSKEFLLMDTAGIRRKTKVTENIEYYSVNRAIKSINDADIVILMIDANEGLTDQDKKIAALAHDKGRGIIMALNKWDTMPKQKNTFKTAEDKIHFQFGQMEYAPILAVSAKDGTGVDKILSAAVKMYGQLNTHVSTSRLNQALENWIKEYPPPSGPQTRFKIKYAVQKSANPVHFILFVSRERAVSDSYISYLRNKIRKDFEFSLIPIIMEIKSSSK